MKITNIGPLDEHEEEIFAVERFRVEVQNRIAKVMAADGISRAELARRLGVSPTRVSQIFSPSCNVTVRLLARVFHALGDEPRLDSRRLDELARQNCTAWALHDTTRNSSREYQLQSKGRSVADGRAQDGEAA